MDILVDDFRSRGRIPFGKDSHLRERLLGYKCEVKSHIRKKWKS